MSLKDLIGVFFQGKKYNARDAVTQDIKHAQVYSIYSLWYTCCKALFE